MSAFCVSFTDIHHPARTVSNTCSPEQESQSKTLWGYYIYNDIVCIYIYFYNDNYSTYTDSLDAGRRRQSTTEMKKTTLRGAELAPLLPMPEPVSPAGKTTL